MSEHNYHREDFCNQKSVLAIQHTFSIKKIPLGDMFLFYVPKLRGT